MHSAFFQYSDNQPDASYLISITESPTDKDSKTETLIGICMFLLASLLSDRFLTTRTLVFIFLVHFNLWILFLTIIWTAKGSWTWG